MLFIMYETAILCKKKIQFLSSHLEIKMQPYFAIIFSCCVMDFFVLQKSRDTLIGI
jgi:hypothetical protein